ncbi:MAG: hypothetical protein Q8N35_06165 [Methylococcaceae bacterium]|nr:hypothetical protein [Methylococcaceae bacterium]MDZ4219069.1 hypothetical protein [Methylobacter sp.]MDP2394118.1 hypothetical protein [Methylococcaceae bacterium]MDP3019153.1 hypothetical protein [Methylococcaceae bacterium]MDP3388692.1 hypothetical protein [Methylococcaceae bacterium]
MSAFTAQPGWKAIIATPDKTNLTGFKVLSYPVIGWQTSQTSATNPTVDPITPIGLLGGYVAVIAPDDGVFSKCPRGKQYPSVAAWLEDIKSTHGAYL